MLYQFSVYNKVTQLHIYIYPLFFRFFSHLGCYKVLGRISCAIQQIFVGYLFQVKQYVRVQVCTSQTPSLSLTLTLPCGNVEIILQVCGSDSVLLNRQTRPHPHSSPLH